MVQRLLPWWLRGVQASDRLRLAWLRARHPGLEIHPEASTNLAVARFALAPGGTVRIAAGVATERLRGRLHFHVEAGGVIEVGEGAWLRTEIAEVHLVAFSGGHLSIGPRGFVNGAHLSCKRELRLEEAAQVGPGSRVFDADQHDFDDSRPEGVAPVVIGAHAWVASDCTIMKGVSIGAHAIVGARSVVTRDVLPHTLVAGAPARPLGEVGDRSRAR